MVEEQAVDNLRQSRFTGFISANQNTNFILKSMVIFDSERRCIGISQEQAPGSDSHPKNNT
jgi:hypothetical protein